MDKSYPLSEAPDAIRHLETGRARGKDVISGAPDEGPTPRTGQRPEHRGSPTRA
ncbi:MAG: zinc-binding dehydrogenase [Actinomycetota bacterium]